MSRVLAYRVVKEYNSCGWMGFYSVQYQDSSDYNWHTVTSYYIDMKQAECIAHSFAKTHNVLAYDLGGYEITM